MKKLALGVLGAFLLAVAFTGVYDVATGQPIGTTTLALTPGSSTVAPAIRATGAPANISINLVPKGTGTVQVAGVPIVASGGTATSLTINPGPLAVTGTTNLTGPLFIQPGTAVGLKAVGARTFSAHADAPTVGTVLETLYTYTVPANTLSADGQSLRIVTVATTAANANNKTYLITFGATTIFNTTAAGFNNDHLYVTCDLLRTGAATQKAICFSSTTEINALTNGAGANLVSTITTPAETLSGAVAMLFRGTTPTAAADLTARYATVDWYPAGQ